VNQANWRNNWPWLAAGVALIVLLWVLAPILTPFVIGAGLAYLGDPLVDRLQKLRLSRTAGTMLVFVVSTLLSLAMLFLLVPMLQKQFVALIGNIPLWFDWLQTHALPAVGLQMPSDIHFDAAGLQNMLSEHWAKAGNLVKLLWGKLATSGLALVTLFANLLLIPIVTFYLLRDWDDLVGWIRSVIPPRMLPRLSLIAGETDQVLGAFIRGQLSVMAGLTLFYWVALWLIGLDLWLIVGLIIGLISFVPYLGAIVGVLTATIAMLVQTHDPTTLIWLAVVFGIGQFLESNVLTPWLVGDQIGLHAVAVMFAVMAGGQLFGFIGVLLALPVAAVIAVLLRHAKQEWLRSALYLGDAPSERPPGEPPAP